MRTCANALLRVPKTQDMCRRWCRFCVFVRALTIVGALVTHLLPLMNAELIEDQSDVEKYGQ